MELDPLDTRILAALSEDARTSLRALARLVDSTAPTVSARLARLEETGVIEGYAARLDPVRLPGRTRLVSGRIAKERTAEMATAARAITGLLEGVVHKDGRFQVTAQVADLEAEEDLLAALAEAGAQDMTVRPVRRFTGPGTAHLFHGAIVVPEPCAVCGKDTGADPVETDIDGRRVAFCCTSCRGLYLERYEHLKART